MEDTSSFYVCDICHRRIPMINRLLHNTRCSAFHSDLAPAPATEVTNRPHMNLPSVDSSGSMSSFVPSPTMASGALPFWECQHCTFHNKNNEALQCEVCGVSKVTVPGVVQSIEREQQASRGVSQNILDDSSHNWECGICTCLNSRYVDYCQACMHPQPPRASTTERLVDPVRRRSAPGVVAAPLSAATSALYGAGAGAVFAWMRGESITRGAFTGAGVGFTTGVLLNELSEMTRHAERMNHADIDIDRHGGDAWDHDRDAERNDWLMTEMRALLEALPVEMGSIASNEQRGINDEQIAELPNYTFAAATTQQQTVLGSNSSGAVESLPQECAVCLQAYNPGEQIRTLPCFHQFHTQCVDRWLRMNAKCPICKTTTVTHA